MITIRFSQAAYCLLVLAIGASAIPAPDHPSADEILSATGITGGLIVHFGCRDGRLTAALRKSDAYVVHGLDQDPKNVAKARQYIQGIGRYGVAPDDGHG